MTLDAQVAARDGQHLQLLAIFHFIVAGLMALFACFFLIYFGMGVFFATGHGAPNGPPAFVGWMFMLLGGVGVLAGWTLAACVVAAGRNLTRARRHTFCLVVAGLLCMVMPFGTVLGVFTILVLLRPSVQARFGVAAAPAA
jgi:hypothetical protein